ncbi:YwqJ-related putative deaminase [Streptomyces sp. NPDC056347]|uniref:YwqJ-related putative deaminase n=1 Tax=Streptomyces sp. NPDC056347 TaxID=3345790 RepID=UPI0035DBB045
MDTRTGTIIEGINGKREVVIKEKDLHPTLKDRLDKIGDPPPHEDEPLGHAEVKAANELLWMRTRQGLPDGTEALTEMRAAVEVPYLKDVSAGLQGRRAPFCANCNHILEGLPSKNGRFTGYPPSEENWIP